MARRRRQGRGCRPLGEGMSWEPRNSQSWWTRPNPKPWAPDGGNSAAADGGGLQASVKVQAWTLRPRRVSQAPQHGAKALALCSPRKQVKSRPNCKKRQNCKYSQLTQESRGATTEGTERSDTQYSMLDANILMQPNSDECVSPQACFCKPQSQKEFRFL